MSIPHVQPSENKNELPTLISMLIVDDDPLVLDMLADVLDEAHLDVVFAKTADEALEQFSTGKVFDILVTDYRMPGTINGFELAIAASHRLPQMKVLIATGFDASDVQTQSADLNFTILQKPYNPFDLKDLIETLASTT